MRDPYDRKARLAILSGIVQTRGVRHSNFTETGHFSFAAFGEAPPSAPWPVLRVGDQLPSCKCAMNTSVATVFRKLVIPKGIASDLTIDDRAVATELAHHLIDRNLALDKIMKAAPIGEGQLLMA